MTGRRGVGLVTIGQSPRIDVVPEMIGRLSADLRARLRVIERGALDELGPEQLAALAPRAGEAMLVTALRDGSEVSVSEPRLLPLLQAAVDDVVSQGAAVVAVLCTGAVGGLRCSRPLLTPGPLLRDLVAVAAGGARLGVLVPAPDQVAAARSDWSAVSDALQVRAASPYGPAANVERAARELGAWHPDLLILDCLGFGESMRAVAAGAAGVPVLLPRAVLAGAIASFA